MKHPVITAPHSLYGSFESLDGQATINYRIYEAPSPALYVALAIHGGCFHDGDENYNSQQSALWAEHGITVMQLGFRQDSPVMAISDLTQATRVLRTLYPQQLASNNLGIIGCSSGGHYSLLLSANPPDQLAYGFAIHLCPVALPFARHLYFKKRLGDNGKPLRGDLLQKQLSHFGSGYAMKMADELTVQALTTLGPNTLFILGDEDQNVPTSRISGLASVNLGMVRVIVMTGRGHEICYRADKQVTNYIIDHIGARKTE